MTFIPQYAMLLILSVSSNARVGCSFNQTLMIGDRLDPSLHSDDRPSLFCFAFVNVNGEIADEWWKASSISIMYPGADTRLYINKIVLRLVLGPCIWSSSRRFLFLSCYGIKIFALDHDFQEPLLCLLGWFTISEKKFVPFTCESTLYNNILRSNHVILYQPGMERTASGSKQLPWYWMRESVVWRYRNQVRIFKKQKWIRILLFTSAIVHNCAIFTPPDLLETDVLSIFDKIQQVPSDLAMRPVQLQDIEWPSEPLFLCSLFGDENKRGHHLAKLIWEWMGNLLSLTPLYEPTRSATSRVLRWSWLYL